MFTAPRQVNLLYNNKHWCICSINHTVICSWLYVFVCVCVCLQRSSVFPGGKWSCCWVCLLGGHLQILKDHSFVQERQNALRRKNSEYHSSRCELWGTDLPLWFRLTVTQFIEYIYATKKWATLVCYYQEFLQCSSPWDCKENKGCFQQLNGSYYPFIFLFLTWTLNTF